MKTLVYIDHFKGAVQPASWEALGVAKTFGTASAVVLGTGLDEVAKAAFEIGADEVLLADDAALTDYRAEAFAGTLAAICSAQSPDLILLPTTTRTREMAAMTAMDLKTGVLVDLTGLRWKTESWLRLGRSTRASSKRRSSARESRSSRHCAAVRFPDPHRDASRQRHAHEGGSEDRMLRPRSSAMR